MNPHDAIFHEELFNQTAGWKPMYSDSRFTQRGRVEPRGAMYTETRLVIQAPAEAVVAKLWGDWTWWRKGRQCNRLEHADGTVEYDHYPFSHNVHVHSFMYPPLELEDGGRRIRVEISDYMTGTMYFDVLPRGNAACELISRFSRCWVSGPYRFLPYPGQIAVWIHLAAERGRFPWPRGTGFPGLIDELEGPGSTPR